MSVFESLNLIQGAIAIGLLMWFFLRPWQEQVIDVARHELFVLRDRIFDMATDGKLDRESAVYLKARDTLNRRTRYLHESTLKSYLAVEFVHARDTEPTVWELGKLIDAVEDDGIRDELSDIFDKVAAITLIQMAKRSLVVLILGPPIMILSDWYNFWNKRVPRVKSEINRYADQWEDQAMA